MFLGQLTNFTNLQTSPVSDRCQFIYRNEVYRFLSPYSVDIFHTQISAFYMLLTETNRTRDAILIFPNDFLAFVTFEACRYTVSGPVCIPRSPLFTSGTLFS